MLEVSNRDTTSGVYITTRSERRLFNVFRLKAKTKVRQLCVRDLLYADDTGFVSHSEVDLQTIHDRFATASASLGFTINVGKTEPLNVAATFKYLGSTIANDCSLDKELSARIQSASAAFGRLREQLWNKHNIKLVTKCKVYRAIILSCHDCHIYTYATYEPSSESGGRTG